MVSDYDAKDATDLESVEDDFCRDESAVEDDFCSDESAVEDEGAEEFYGFSDDELDNSGETVSHCHQNYYTVLDEPDIRQQQEDDISRVSNVLSTSRVHACLLLRHFNWSVSKVHDEWFADEETVCKAVGLLVKPVELPNAREFTCSICFEVYPCKEMKTAPCGHPFCSSCWRGYIGAAIADGPGCLTLRCPHPSCSIAIGQDMIDIFASCEDKKKYSHYLLKSYIENNRKIKWCPAPGCEFAIDFIMGCGTYDVSCNCSYSFCWNCMEEAHRPVECGTVVKWLLKYSTESENMNWILANSKPCPKCKRPIQKSHGCMHMVCGPPCKFQFCWLCLKPWAEHLAVDFYSCNIYNMEKIVGVYDESKKRRERAKNSLTKYTHYFERWTTNQKSRQKAESDLHNMQTQKLKMLSISQCLPETHLNFITDAMLQVIECRRVLKWTYAYGYYLSEHERAKKQFFEYLQGEAEAGLERLHQCAEKDLQVYLEAEVPMKEFTDFRRKLVGLTCVTRKYFENLVQALENGLEDVGPYQQSNGSKTSSSENFEGEAGENSGWATDTYEDYWLCDRCTYANPISARSCQICNHHSLTLIHK